MDQVKDFARKAWKPALVAVLGVLAAYSGLLGEVAEVIRKHFAQ